MQWAYAQSGVQIPRVTYTQIEAPNGVEVADRADLKPGDLVFFANAAATSTTSACSSAATSSCTRRTPATSSRSRASSEPYYARQFAGGRRFDAGAPVAAAPPRRRARRRVRRGRRAAAAAPAIDPTEVAKAQAAVARDAAEVRRNDSQLFQAIKAVEATQGAREAATR